MLAAAGGAVTSVVETWPSWPRTPRIPAAADKRVWWNSWPPLLVMACIVCVACRSSYLIEHGIHHGVERHGNHGVCLRFILHLLHCHPPGRSSSWWKGEEETAAHTHSRIHTRRHTHTHTLWQPNEFQSDESLKKKRWWQIFRAFLWLWLHWQRIFCMKRFKWGSIRWVTSGDQIGSNGPVLGQNPVREDGVVWSDWSTLNSVFFSRGSQVAHWSTSDHNVLHV